MSSGYEAKRPSRNPANDSMTDSLWRHYVKHRDGGTRAQLLRQYLGLVHHAARDFARRMPAPFEIDDLVSAGTVGLVQALETFDPNRGLAFSSFAVPRIRGAILDELRAWDWEPRTVRERRRDIAQAESELTRKLGRPAVAEEVARELGCDMRTYYRYQVDVTERTCVALDPVNGAERQATALAETIPDSAAPNPCDSLIQAEALESLQRAFTGLSARDQLVLVLSFYEKLNLQQIGEVLHITPSRVCQIRARALQRLSEKIGRD